MITYDDDDDDDDDADDDVSRLSGSPEELAWQRRLPGTTVGGLPEICESRDLGISHGLSKHI
jgi:hypothetical protein